MRLLTLALAVTLPVAISAQTAAPTPTDARTMGWQVRTDDPKTDASKLSFVVMKPGWHITTGPVSGVLFHPDMTGTGNFTAQTSVYFFPPKSAHEEAYGLVVGGKDLAGTAQSYTYFLARNDGKFMIKRRTGAATSMIMAWTDAGAIKKWKTGDSPALNVLTIKAGAKDVVFRINDVVVAKRPRATTPVDGIVGFRANHFLDLHVRDLTVTASK
ncbi:MAG: hypothetical protein ABIR59_08685 [Gemmatimonadales bacterium]